ncbi:MAG: mannose-phosphate guanylyltransferase [Acidimicrobiaceae bacterium]|nr:mannose-phosphate guanylyltransferase [Acidimicrobiaceae bacterium]MDQ1416552.1 mannose-phosphate guanylyltransferase [Acidimicrobiaceae bacterium]MDQ1442072.1 mannose-phosphate guanylyltransferase [Acidimicrobiaceae bacterium]
MKAVVLVGGRGTRLRPLTLTRPKQMLPVAGRPMIERVLAHLAKHGVDEVILSLGYRPDAFREAYPDGLCAGVRLQYAVEPEPRDTAGGLAFAARFAGVDETFLVQNGDVLTDLDVTALVAFHRHAGGAATISLTPVDDPSRFGVVATDERGRVTSFVEKPEPGAAPSDLINAGTYALEPEVLEHISHDRPESVERDTFPALVAEGSLYALASDADWVDAGTVLTYLHANLALARREEHWIDTRADVDPAAHVSGSVIGAGAVVSEGACIERALVMSGARVGRSAIVRDSIIGAGAVVGDRAVIEALSILGDGVAVEAGMAASGRLFPASVS